MLNLWETSNFCDVSDDGGLSEKSLESVATGAVAEHLGVKDTLQAELVTFNTSASAVQLLAEY